MTTATRQVVERILRSSEWRDTSSLPYADGLASTNPAVKTLAQRELWRSRDPLFAKRDSLPALPAPPKYDEPAWRLRFRAMGRDTTNCAGLATAIADESWHVRLRAADLVRVNCTSDAQLMATLRAWAQNPATNAVRPPAGVSWHSSAHALVALARVAPADARALLPRYVASPVPHLRNYAAQAAGIVNDTASLRRLAADANDNVKETAVTALARVAGHSSDDVILGAVSAQGYQAVRAAARALKESPRGDAVLSAALTMALRLRGDSSETSRDARMALVERIAEFAKPADWPRIAPLLSDFDCTVAKAVAAIGTKLGVNDAARCVPLPISLPPNTASIALGAAAPRLRVVMADSSGGGVIVVRLRGDIAPIMAARVLELAQRGAYNGLTWHRVEPDFVVQGGGGGNEYVGHPRFFRDELGTVPHVRGTVGMSTRGHDTGDGQWFFNVRDNLRLNRDYTVFAEVIEGIEVVDRILEGDVIARVEVVR